MNSLKKQLLSTLFLTSLLATAPLCATAVNGNEKEVEVQEEIPTPWYKQSEIQKIIFVGAFSIATIYLGYKAFEHTQFMQETLIPLLKGMGRTLAAAGAPAPRHISQINHFQTITLDQNVIAKIKEQGVALAKKLEEDLALTKSFLGNDPDYPRYIKELKDEFLKNMVKLYEGYGFKNIVATFSNDGSLVQS